MSAKPRNGDELMTDIRWTKSKPLKLVLVGDNFVFMGYRQFAGDGEAPGPVSRTSGTEASVK